jgi:hypothetical protein
LGIETSRKGVLLGQNRTVALQIIGAATALVHPLAQALVSDELDQANGLVDSPILLIAALTLLFVGQHGWSPLACDGLFCYTEYTSIDGI